LVQEATNRIVQSFRAWDTDGSGSLSRSEFAKAMAVIGFHCTSEELLSLFEQLDADGSGTIAYAELLGALRDATPGTTPSRPAATATGKGGTGKGRGKDSLTPCFEADD
jgi:Ca2+-binding EF-hand superfamily protein